MIPKPSARGRFPFEVSSAMAVVIVRVKPSMLPPTIITAPTSAAARPKPASSAVSRLKRASNNSVVMRPSEPTSIAYNSSRYSSQRSSIVWRVRAAIIGRIRRACAMIIAAGVNKIPRSPSGPERDSRRYTAKPTTTGGNPMKALTSTTTAPRPENSVSARSAPSGSPSKAASPTADRLTASDSLTIAKSAGCRSLSFARRSDHST